jgi:hypothetical protein
VNRFAANRRALHPLGRTRRRRYNAPMRAHLISRLLLVLTLAASGCAYSIVDKGQLRQGPFDAVVRRTAAARGIEPRGPIEVAVTNPDEVEAVIRRAITREWSKEQIRRYEWAYVVLGVWPIGRDLLEAYVDVMREEVGGLYDPGDRSLYLVDHGKGGFRARVLSALLQRDLEREMILAHELVHLLQHERYPLLIESDPFFYDHDDAAAAIQAAVEGDATRYGIEALDLNLPLPDPDELRRSIDSELAAAEDGALARAPALIRLTLGFPYAYGYGLALAEGTALLEAPPISTEQVLHRDERHAPFVVVDLGGALAGLPNTCSVVRENTLGELGISVLLRDLDENADPEVWMGWDGDRYLVAECDGRPELLWLTLWDSQTDAIEFEAAYRDLGGTLVSRSSLSVAPVVVRDGREVLIYSRGFAKSAGDLVATAPRRSVASLRELQEHFATGPR